MGSRQRGVLAARLWCELSALLTATKSAQSSKDVPTANTSAESVLLWVGKFVALELESLGYWRQSQRLSTLEDACYDALFVP